LTRGANKLLVRGTDRWQRVENSRTCLIPSRSFPSRTSTWGTPSTLLTATAIGTGIATVLFRQQPHSYTSSFSLLEHSLHPRLRLSYYLFPSLTPHSGVARGSVVDAVPMRQAEVAGSIPHEVIIHVPTTTQFTLRYHQTTGD
jgi:hypothetical protein